jgi:hypothetical protein
MERSAKTVENGLISQYANSGAAVFTLLFNWEKYFPAKSDDLHKY